MLRNILKLFELDLRSLAATRILLGLFLFKDFIEIIPHIKMFYTRDGFIPLSEGFQTVFQNWSWSLLYMNDAPLFVYGFFFVYAILLLFFIFGYRTQCVTFLLWVFIVSIHNRNWMGLNSGDDLVRCSLLILTFLPLGAKYSVDEAFTNKKNINQSHNSIWNVTLFVQLAAMYITSALHKTDPAWNQDFSALARALQLDAFTTPLADIIKGFPSLLKAMTFITYYAEKYLIFLFFLGAISRVKNLTRWITIGTFVLIHLGIFIFMNVGNFPLYAIALWFAFMPGSFWKIITYSKHSKLNIYYDGHCRFCEKFVRILLTFLASRELHLYQAQSNKEVCELMEAHNSWVVREINGKTFYGFEAFQEVIKRSHFQFLYPLFNRSWVKRIGEKFYQIVSNNRPLLSKFSSFLQFSQKPNYQKNFITEFLAILIIILTVNWCWSVFPNNHSNEWANSLKKVSRWVHHYQYWNIFSPTPQKTNAWFFIKGVTDTGSQVDLTSKKPRAFTLKTSVNGIRESLENKSIRKTFMRILDDPHFTVRLGNYYCRKWNLQENHSSRLDKVEFYMGKELVIEPNNIREDGIELVNSVFCQ